MTKARDLANAGTALTTVSATELGYLDGVTSAVQTQLNAKQAVVSGVNDTEIGYLDGVTSAIQTQIDGKQAINANVSTTELGYLDGVTSAIQTQLDAKIAKTLTTTTGDIIYASSANTPARLGIGSTDQVLKVSGGVPTWATASSGALTLITSGTLSGSSTTFSNCFSSTYDSYIVIFTNMARGGSATKGTISLAGETGYYKGSLMGIDYAGAVSAQQNNNGANPWVMGQIDSGSGLSSAIWDITFRGSSGARFASFWRQMYCTDPIAYYGSMISGNTVAMTGFTMGWDGSGSWGGGTVRVYGVAK